MTGLISGQIAYKVSRFLSIALVILAGAIFLFTSSSGFYAWKYSFYEPNGVSVETVLAAIEALVFLPGITPLIAAFYFFIYLKSLLYNLIGLFAMIPIIFVHFLFSVPATHSSVLMGIGISIIELLFVIGALWLFNKFIVQSGDDDDKGKEKEGH